MFVNSLIAPFISYGITTWVIEEEEEEAGNIYQGPAQFSRG